MDDILTFLNEFSNNYPKSWLKTEDYVISLIARENGDPLDIKSKYVKKHMCLFKSNGIEYILKKDADPKDIKILGGMFDLDLIDYVDVFKNFDFDYFDLDGWSAERLENEVNEVRELLFKCNKFKAVFFIDILFKEIILIEDSLNDLWKIISPNWLQEEIVLALKKNLKYLKQEILEDFLVVYPDLENVLGNNKNLKTGSNLKTQGNWYIIAQLMADGTIVITNKGEYMFKGALVKVEMEMSRLISGHLNNTIKPQSIKPYLNKTKFPRSSSVNSDKNIFIESRVNELTFIASEAQKNDSVSDYFRAKLEELKKEIAVST
jgi:hypothetical protein